MNQPHETHDAIVDELKTFLADFPGSQRELLAALEASWISRMLEHDGGARAIAASLIRKKVKSKKLVAERDALVEKLFDQGGA